MKTTLVTGATGGIGAAVVRRFLDRGDEVIAMLVRATDVTRQQD